MLGWSLPASSGSSRTSLASLLGNTSPATSSTTKFVRPASRLHAEVQSFLSLIADSTEIHSYSYSETEEVMEEAQKMPLGRLSKTTIKRVRDQRVFSLVFVSILLPRKGV